MMRNLVILIGMAAALSLSGCQAETDAQADEVASTGAAEDEISAPELSEQEAETRAFEAAWEAGPPVTASDARLNDEDDNRWPEPVAGRFEFREGQVVRLSTDLYALISSGHAVGGGTNARGALAFHYLSRTEDGFRRLDVSPIFIAGGTGGEPPAFTVREGLMPAPAVILTTPGGCAKSQIVELTPSHPVLRASDIPTARTTAGSEGAWEAEFQPGRVGRDFEVQYSGASEATATWILTDMGTYRPATPPRLPGC